MPACLQPIFHGQLLSVRVFSADEHYTIVFLSRNYRLIVAPRKFDVLKTNICARSEASRANMLYAICYLLLLSLLLIIKFSSARQFRCFARRDTLILNSMLHELTEFFEVNLHRSFPKQSLDKFSFSCCKYVLLLSFLIFLKLFCEYSVYIHKFCSVKTVCV